MIFSGKHHVQRLAVRYTCHQEVRNIDFTMEWLGKGRQAQSGGIGVLQLKNSSPFKPAIALFPDADGIDTLYIVVKATFELADRLEIAEEQVPPTLADEYWDEPETSSLKYASDMHLGKPSTDVVLVGQAWAPEGKKVRQLDMGVAAADRRKLVRVFGDRVWRKKGASFTAPEPFESLPLVYERAYGGTQRSDPAEETAPAEERNPVGRGFRGERKPAEAEGQPLPNIEDPKNLIKSWGDQAAPQGFGFVAPAWLPRRSYAGTYDDDWQKKRAPYLPADFDARFFNAAHPDLVFDGYLEGGEPIQVVGASPKGRLRFRLPICDLEATVRVAGKTEEPPLSLETVLIEPDEARLCMTWRAALPCDKKTLKVEQIDIALDRLDLSGTA